ncbi:MAG: NAD(P)/FAD-dependent oxidoreductase [Candidatus Krumholzibacteria bacterium]|nr:NAD(P)/FAD-dependent oxidoreductase [Candidatus Krumholzibacteria bacterium]
MHGEQVIIVGAGPAGAAAAIQCRRLGVIPRLLDRTGAAGGLAENAHCIENYPGMPGAIGGTEFTENLRAHLARFDIAVEGTEVTGIARNGKGFSVRHGSGELSARAVILASGTVPRRAHIAGEEELDGVHVFYDVVSLLRRRGRPRDVVVVGGGEAACDYALTLASIGAAVLLVVRSDRLKARGRLAHAVQQTPAIRVSYGTAVERISTSPLLTVCLRSTVEEGATEHNPGALLVAVGRDSAAPRLLAPLGVTAAEGIAGTIPGLFVVGDARIGSLGQIGMAVGDGIRAAAASAALMENL